MAAGALLAALFGALGIVLGGSFRVEITLAVANLVWFVACSPTASSFR